MSIVFGLFERAKLKGESDDVDNAVVLTKLIELDELDELDELEAVAIALEDLDVMDRMVG